MIRMSITPGPGQPGQPATIQRRRRTLVLMILLGWLLLLGAPAPAAPARLEWSEAAGVAVHWAGGQVRLGGHTDADAIIVRFVPQGGERRLVKPERQQAGQNELALRYSLQAPGGQPLTIERELKLVEGAAGALALTERFTVTATQATSPTLGPFDLEIERPFQIEAPGEARLATLPLRNGWARPLALDAGGEVSGEYRLGYALTGSHNPLLTPPAMTGGLTSQTLAGSVPHLALPLVQLSGADWRCALMADPYFSACFRLRQERGTTRGALVYRYLSSRVPLRQETRTFGLWLRQGAGTGPAFSQALDAFFTHMLPEVAPGPQWPRQIAMIGYDYFSDKGQGWEKDVKALAAMLSPAERAQVCLCLHGWYDALFPYCYEPARGELRWAWLPCRERSQWLTLDELRRRLRLARGLGFRVVLYYSCGLSADMGTPYYNEDWTFTDLKGQKGISGWVGPDNFGRLAYLNPAHPKVKEWYCGYMDALLKAFGPDVDGFVWDETHYIQTGMIAARPEPSYSDRAFFELVKAVRARVKAYDPEKVLLVSDNTGPGLDTPGYAMVADGNYQDTEYTPATAPYGLFANYRNSFWDCVWGAVGTFHTTEWCAETFGYPVAVTNGWGSDLGPSEWTPYMRERFLRAFRNVRQRLAGPGRVRFLTEDPAKLLGQAPDQLNLGDPLPAPGAGEKNWAAAASGAQVKASSQKPDSPATLATDGQRGGQGWASQAGQALPHWLEVDFGQPRAIGRFVVLNYEQDKAETAGKWGVQNYEIQTWDEKRKGWKTVVREERWRAPRTRVHTLKQPLKTIRCRLLVKDTAPLSGMAHLAEFEAWGTAQ